MVLVHRSLSGQASLFCLYFLVQYTTSHLCIYLIALNRHLLLLSASKTKWRGKSTSEGTVDFKSTGGTGDHVGEFDMWRMKKTTDTKDLKGNIVQVPQV